MSKDDLTYVETEGGPFILLPLEPKPLIVGEAEVTAARPTKDGGVFVQRVFGDEDEVLKITLAPGSYAIETARVKTKDVEAGLVRLRRK